MGDRVNIVMHYEDGNKIFFYGHWSGSTALESLRSAIAKKWRWDDEAYFARIVFDEFCPYRGKETGFGIAPYECDNEYAHINVTPSTGTVEVGGKTMTFSEIAEMKHLSWADFGI